MFHRAPYATLYEHILALDAFSYADSLTWERTLSEDCLHLSQDSTRSEMEVEATRPGCTVDLAGDAHGVGNDTELHGSAGNAEPDVQVRWQVPSAGVSIRSAEEQNLAQMVLHARRMLPIGASVPQSSGVSEPMQKPMTALIVVADKAMKNLEVERTSKGGVSDGANHSTPLCPTWRALGPLLRSLAWSWPGFIPGGGGSTSSRQECYKVPHAHTCPPARCPPTRQPAPICPLTLACPPTHPVVALHCRLPAPHSPA